MSSPAIPAPPPLASATVAGLMSTLAQTFAGAKTFNAHVIAGGVGVGTTAALANVAPGLKYNSGGAALGIYSDNNGVFLGINLGTGIASCSGVFAVGSALSSVGIASLGTGRPSGQLGASLPNGVHLGLNGNADTTFIASDATGAASILAYVNNVAAMTLTNTYLGIGAGGQLRLGPTGYSGGNSAFVATHSTGWALGAGMSGHTFDASFGASAGNIMRWQKDTADRALLNTDGEYENVVADKGIILKSPDGTRYRVKVNNGGTLNIAAA